MRLLRMQQVKVGDKVVMSNSLTQLITMNGLMKKLGYLILNLFVCAYSNFYTNY